MTVILLEPLATLSAVIIVTVVRSVERGGGNNKRDTPADNQSENIKLPQSPHYNAPITSHQSMATIRNVQF